MSKKVDKQTKYVGIPKVLKDVNLQHCDNIFETD